jgi:hypothetical protein
MRKKVLQDCPVCGARPEELHKPGCDIEQCAYCGGQSSRCGCFDEDPLDDEFQDSVRLRWAGEWPGKRECREFGWYAKWTEGGWEPCDPGDEGAIEDLDRLQAQTVWDRSESRWVRKGGTNANDVKPPQSQ